MKRDKKHLFRPVSAKRTFEEISEQIKSLIFKGMFKPGDRLPPERELAQMFQTGRMSVREALRTLEEAGLIYTKPGADGGIFVKEPDWTGFTKTISVLFNAGNLTLREITEARLILEKAIIERGFEHFSEDHISALENNILNCERYLSLKDKKNYPTSVDAFLGDFHLLIAETCGNKLLRYFMKAILALYVDQKLYIPDRAEYTKHLLQHKCILQGIKSKDLDATLKALEEHIEHISTYAEKKLHKKRN
ncbi:MAG: GntR family transcriptional regulator [candidate division WOR-3 bacterium]